MCTTLPCQLITYLGLFHKYYKSEYSLFKSASASQKHGHLKSPTTWLFIKENKTNKQSKTRHCWPFHYSDLMMSTVASQITSVSIVCLAICSGADQRKHQISASLAFVESTATGGFPHEGPVTWKVFSLEDVIMVRTQRKHDDVIKWKHFPRYWPFVRGIHRSPVNSPHKGQ